MNIYTEELKSKAVRLAIKDDTDKEIAHGFLFLITNEGHSAPYGLIERVIVDEDQRGKGVGTKLIQAILDKAKELGCYKVIATSRFEKEQVHGLYERFGLVKHGYEFRIDLSSDETSI